MICVLEVIEGPARGRRIWVRENQCVEIGRVSSADFAIPSDLHLSRRHLLLDSTQSGFRVRDMGSANGTFLNNHRVSVHELKSGDRIRAGMTTFLVQLRAEGDNPHDQDGIRFGATIQSLGPETLMSDSQTRVNTSEQPGYRTLDFSNLPEMDSTLRLSVRSDEENPPSSSNSSVTRILDQDAWWCRYFQPTSISNLYEQMGPNTNDQETLVDFFRHFSKDYSIVGVINRSQLSNEARESLEYFSKSGKLTPITQTLEMVDLPNETSSRSLLTKCIGQDAMICVGNRRTPNANMLRLHANALSFPSMFRGYLAKGGAEFQRQLATDIGLALFELGPSGQVGLWLSGS